MREDGEDGQTSQNADYVGGFIHHSSILRNKRCLLAYVYASYLWLTEVTLNEQFLLIVVLELQARCTGLGYILLIASFCSGSSPFASQV